MANSLKRKVLSLYKHILRNGRSWEACNPSETEAEKKYIASEAQKLFRTNKYITNLKSIEEHITEGEARLEIAMHYNTPYPRPVNMPPNTITKAWGSDNRRRQQVSRPVYIKSIDSKT